jgi:hypothetical protein
MSGFSPSNPMPVTLGGTGSTTASAARTALGEGTSATVDTGTSGTKVPLLDGANTWSASQRFNTANPHFGHVAGTGAGFWLDSTGASDRFFFGQDATTNDVFRIYSAFLGGQAFAYDANSSVGTFTGKIGGTQATTAPSFTVATVPSAGTMGAGAMIYVSNEAGGAVIAFSDGTNWRRVTDRVVIS